MPAQSVLFRTPKGTQVSAESSYDHITKYSPENDSVGWYLTATNNAHDCQVEKPCTEKIAHFIFMLSKHIYLCICKQNIHLKIKTKMLSYELCSIMVFCFLLKVAWTSFCTCVRMNSYVRLLAILLFLTSIFLVDSGWLWHTHILLLLWGTAIPPTLLWQDSHSAPVPASLTVTHPRDWHMPQASQAKFSAPLRRVDGSERALAQSEPLKLNIWMLPERAPCSSSGISSWKDHNKPRIIGRFIMLLLLYREILP